MTLQYWKANPHQWGPGQTHLIHEDGTKTLCGVPLAQCPGRHVPGIEYTCRTCARALESREIRQKREQEQDERQRQYQAEQAARDRAWWSWYESYLRSDGWAQKRDLVLRRAGGRCESCGRRRATQVHHTSYAHVGNEPLFELRAVCYDCHQTITEMDRRKATIE